MNKHGYYVYVTDDPKAWAHIRAIDETAAFEEFKTHYPDHQLRREEVTVELERRPRATPR